jgi:peptidyl-prolyl cis-trans isomerase D
MPTNKKSSKIITKKHLARLERERIQNRRIIIISSIILVFVVSLIGYGIVDQYVLQGLKPVAKVGDEVITSKEFQVMVRYDRVNLISQYDQYSQLAAYFSGSSSFQSYLTQIENQLTNTTTEGSSILNSMIDDVLIRKEAERLNITVSDQEIDDELHKSFSYFPDGTLTPTITSTLSNTTPTVNPTSLFWVSPTPTATQTFTSTPIIETQTPTLTSTPTVTSTFGPTATATSTPTPYTLDGFETQVSSYLDNFSTYGFSDSEMRKLVESSLYRQKVKDAVTKDLAPVEEEVWARHILVTDEATAESVIQRLNNGEDFATLAAELSSDSGSAASGGDLGWFGKGVMDATFETAVFNLQVGQISDPILTVYGYHIIQVLGHELRPLDSSAFDTYKTTYFNTWLANLRYANRLEITKYNLWMDIVPTDPTFDTSTTTS